MKRAVSVSIGSATRDKRVDTELLGEAIRLERIGSDGDMALAAQLFRQLDGAVDCLGVGGTDLGLQVGSRWYPLHSVRRLVKDVQHTPVVDGGGLKSTLEGTLASFLDQHLVAPIQPRSALITSGVDRWGMAVSFAQAGYRCVFGDLMFALGLPIPIRSTGGLQRLARLLVPLVSRLPFSWLYPTGEAQERREPRWQPYYHWATVIAGDCHYIKRHMPENLRGKIVVTNTTTPEDVALFRGAGIRTLVTSTPVIDGRSFGTNLMEAALVAVAGRGRSLTSPELAELIDELELRPQVRTLGGVSP